MLKNIELLAQQYHQPREGILILQRMYDDDTRYFTTSNKNYARQEYDRLLPECKFHGLILARDGKYYGWPEDKLIRYKNFRGKNFIMCKMYSTNHARLVHYVVLKLILLEFSNKRHKNA